MTGACISCGGDRIETEVPLGVSIPGGVVRPPGFVRLRAVPDSHRARHGIIRAMTDVAADRSVLQGERSSLVLPDGRSLDIWQAGPPDGDALVFHHGTPSAGLPFNHHVREMAKRGLRYVA